MTVSREQFWSTQRWTNIKFRKANINLSITDGYFIVNVVAIEQTSDEVVGCPLRYST